jgi:hypothetical protein
VETIIKYRVGVLRLAGQLGNVGRHGESTAEATEGP